MPARPAQASAPQAPPELYPAVETFISSASDEDIAQLFSGLEAELKKLKGPRAGQGPKAQAAIEQARTLFAYLLEVRTWLVNNKGKKK